MRDRESKKKFSTAGELASEKEIVQKSSGNYKSRYKGELAPKKDIVDEYHKPSYNSRYN